MSCTNRPKSEALRPHVIPIADGILAESRVILLVEDEPLVRKVTGEVLRLAGYRVLKAKNSAEAMRAFRQHGEDVSLLLTDVVMPGRNGCELAHELRAICPELRTILTSGYGEGAMAEADTGEAGVFYLPKPFAVQSLLDKVREALDEDVLQQTKPKAVKHAAGNG